MDILCWIVIGFISGFIVGYGISYKGDLSGTIQIDQSGSDADIYRLVWDIPPWELKTQKYVVFRIDANADLHSSREEHKSYND